MTRSRRSVGTFAALGALAAAFALTIPTIAGQGGRGAGQNGRAGERVRLDSQKDMDMKITTRSR
jgi:hypothetical protein